MLRTSQENEHTTSFGTCSEPVCRAITYAEAADPSGCGHGVEVWPASGDKKGGVRFPYRVARKPPAESTLHKPWGTGKRGAYPRERGEKMVEVVESYGVRSDCGSNPLKDGPVGWKVGRHRGRSMRLLGSGGGSESGAQTWDFRDTWDGMSGLLWTWDGRLRWTLGALAQLAFRP